MTSAELKAEADNTSETLIIPNITKTNSISCFIMHCFQETKDKQNCMEHVQKVSDPLAGPESLEHRIRARIAEVNTQPGSHHGQSKKHEHDGFKQMSQVHELQRERRLLDPSLLEKIPI